MAKNVPKIDNVGDFFAIFRPITTIKLYKNLYLVEGGLSFNLLGHM